MKNLLKYIPALFAIMVITSCDDEMEEAAVTATELSLHFHPMVNGEEFSYNDTYSINGQSVKFSVVQFYISNLQLMQSDQTMLSFNKGTDDKEDDLFLLVQPDQMLYEVGTVPVGGYHGLSFQLGVDTVVNSTIEPTAWPKAHALSADNPNHAYWSWKSGYLFVKLEGTVNGENFVYHIGTNNLLTPSGMLEGHTELTNATSDLMVMYNIGNFLKNVDMTKEANRDTHTFNNPELAKKIMTNVKASFSVMSGNHGMM